METVNAFAGNPIVALKRDAEQVSQWLHSPDSATKTKVLPFCEGKPLVDASVAPWTLAWLALEDVECYGEERDSHLVYLGDDGVGISYFAIAVPADEERAFGRKLVTFFDLRSLMQAADYGNEGIMGELSIAGHARAMLEWHKQASFCGRCGSSSRPILCGQRRQCSNVKCNNKLYPRLDPVVIMLVIDKERDCAILGRQSRFVPRMWSCIAGFIEPGESLEEAVRRETREEVGLEVGDIVYHSSQPWPVGPSSMSCQLMVGFFAYAKSFEIRVDKKELEDAQWHRREDVRKILQNTRYKRDQQEALLKLQKAASGDTSRTKPSSSPNGNGNEIAFVPGPYAIAHHLISTWANQGPVLTQSNI
jgi:NAD+ diphosphatase